MAAFSRDLTSRVHPLTTKPSLLFPYQPKLVLIYRQPRKDGRLS